VASPGSHRGRGGTRDERAAVEDDDARELLLRVAVLQQANRGNLRSRFTEVAEEGFDTAEHRYQSVLAGKPEAKEAHEIMKRLFNELEKRLPPDLSPPEGDARVAEILSEDSNGERQLG
jgi:hypothetical protein